MKDKAGTIESITAEGCSVRIVNAAAVTHPVKHLTEVPIQWTTKKKVLYVGSGYSFKLKDLQNLTIDTSNPSIQLEAYNKKQQLLQCSIVLDSDVDHSNAAQAKRAFADISKKLQKQWTKMEQKKAAAAKITPAAQRKHRTYSKRPKTFAQRLGHQQRHNLHAPHWSSDEEGQEEELPQDKEHLPDKKLHSDHEDDDSEQERQFLDDDAMAQDTSADYMEATALDDDDENKENDDNEDDSDDDEIIPSKTKSRPKKRFKRKMVLDDDSDDDDEFFVGNDASVKHNNDVMTTPKPLTQRIVSPSTLVASPMHKKSKTTATTVSSAKGKANIKSFFAPKTTTSTSAAKRTTPLKMNRSKFFAKTTPSKQENDPLEDSSDEDETVKADIFSSPTPKSKKTNDMDAEGDDPVQDSDDDDELVATPLPASSSRTVARQRLGPRSFGRKASTSETKTSSFGSSTLTLTLNSPARQRNFQLANAMASTPPRTPSKKHPTSTLATTTTPVKKAPLPKIRGLRNLGNTCYLNSSLQCLFSIPSFVQALGKQLSTTDETKNKAPLTKVLVELYQELQPQHRPAKSPTEVKHRVDDTTSKFAGYQQRDAHEWMAHVVDQVHEELVVSSTKQTQNQDKDSEKVTLPTDDYFRINVQVCLTCKSCGYARYVFPLLFSSFCFEIQLA